MNRLLYTVYATDARGHFAPRYGSGSCREAIERALELERAGAEVLVLDWTGHILRRRDWEWLLQREGVV